MTPTGTVTVEASVDAKTETRGGLSCTVALVRLCVCFTLELGQSVTLEDMSCPPQFTGTTQRADAVITLTG